MPEKKFEYHCSREAQVGSVTAKNKKMLDIIKYYCSFG